jgi:HIRAN domain
MLRGVELLRRFRPAAPVRAEAASATYAVQVAEDTHCFDGEDGTRWWSVGLAPVYPDSDGENHFMPLGESLCEGQVLYCKVAGVQHYGSAVGNHRFAKGSTTQLIPEPENEYDTNAVGVWDSRGRIQVGHIPADCCAKLAARIGRGEHLVGYVLREIRRDSKSGPRTGLHLLVVPAGELALSVVDR